MLRLGLPDLLLGMIVPCDFVGLGRTATTVFDGDDCVALCSIA